MILESGKNATIITYNGITPKLHSSVFTCHGVRIIGDVEIDEDCSIWYNTVIRGDVHFIRIGKRTNIQDMSMLHVTNDTYPLIIGNDVSIGHSVTLHGCTLQNSCMIGIGAICLDGSTIESNSVVAAGSLVKEKFIVPSGTLVAGVPAKVVKEFKPEEVSNFTSISAKYLNYINIYKEQFNNNL